MPVELRPPPAPRPATKARVRRARLKREFGESLGPALFVTLLLHLALIKVVPASGFFSSENTHPVVAHNPKPMKVSVAPPDKAVPANLLPPQMRPTPPKLVEVNPLAPTRSPDHNRNTGAAEQKAAQPDPVPTDKGERAKVKGENPDSTRIINAIPREFLDKSLRPAPGQPVGLAPPAKTTPAASPKPADGAKREDGPAAKARLPEGKAPMEKGRAFTEKSGEEKTTEPGPADKKPDEVSKVKKTGAKDATGKEGAKKAAPADKTAVSAETAQDGPDAPPRPRPAATLAGTTGPLGVTLVGAGDRGTIAADSKFSKMGEYASRMFEIIQAAWWAGVDRSRISDRGTVVIEFTLHKNGTVTGAHIKEKTTSDLAAYLCLDAITGRAPFDEWPEDMVGIIGDKQEGTITFHYR